LAFASNRSGHTEIWTSDAQGGNLMALTSMGTLATFAGTPRWSPDGLEIAFDARPGGNPDIYVVSAQGGAPHRMTTDPAEDVLPSFSRDGQWIYFSSNRSGDFQLWKVRRSGADAVQLTRQGAVAGLESADGRYVYYVNTRHDNELWRVPIAGGTEELLFKGADIWKGAHWRRFWGWWTVGAEGIVYIDGGLSGPHPSWQIKRFDVQKRAISVLADIPRQPAIQVPCITISPDGRSAVYSQVDESVRTIMLLENFR
jgi:dipeptidyl aminopeptidase/acylaminoacyl peptidase